MNIHYHNQTPYQEDFAELNTSSQVREVQAYLQSKGYDLGHYGVDGKLGRMTKSALYNYFKTKIQGGTPHVSPPTPTPTPPSGGSKLDRFISAHGHKTFSNSQDINAFFTAITGKDFCTWFKDHIGNKGYWGRITFEGRSKSGRNIPSRGFDTHRANFNAVWDNISLIFNGRLGQHRINIFQFFALVSIIINETGGKFTPIGERGSLRYMFGTNNGKKRSYNTSTANKSAYDLFRNRSFLNAHRNLAYYNRVAHTSNRAWDGDTFPSGFPTDPSRAGIIAEADFYKFRGRGLIQTTFRSTYGRLLNFIKTYSGANPVLQAFKAKWQHLDNDTILYTSSNNDWDTLFLQTQLEFPCYAIYNFQHRRNQFLQIPNNKSKLLQESRARSGSGSLFYVGYRVGGNSRYGRLLKKRALQMIEALV